MGTLAMLGDEWGLEVAPILGVASPEAGDLVADPPAQPATRAAIATPANKTLAVRKLLTLETDRFAPAATWRLPLLRTDHSRSPVRSDSPQPATACAVDPFRPRRTDRQATRVWGCSRWESRPRLLGGVASPGEVRAHGRLRRDGCSGAPGGNRTHSTNHCDRGSGGVGRCAPGSLVLV